MLLIQGQMIDLDKIMIEVYSLESIHDSEGRFTFSL